MVRLPVASLFLIVSLVATVGFFILGPFPATACYLVVSALAVVAVPVGLRLFRAARRAAVAGHGRGANARRSPSFVAVPSLADAFYLSGLLLLAIGMTLFIRARQPHFRLTAALDAMLIGIAAVLVLWLVAINGIVHDETVPLAQRMVEVAYPIGDALVLATAAYLLLIGRNGRRSLYLLVGSLAALLAADVLTTVAGSTWLPSAADALWLLSYTLFGLAALDSTMRDIVGRTGRPQPGPICAGQRRSAFRDARDDPRIRSREADRGWRGTGHARSTSGLL
ncbi:MAG TPA: hypothetical protein VIK08_00495 [Candidatus Limnocylindrales bacterium]